MLNGGKRLLQNAFLATLLLVGACPQLSLAQPPSAEPWFVQALKMNELRRSSASFPTTYVVGDGVNCNDPALAGRIDSAKSFSVVDSAPCQGSIWQHETSVAKVASAIGGRVASAKIFSLPEKQIKPLEYKAADINAAFEKIADQTKSEEFAIINASLFGSGPELVKVLKSMEKRVLVIASAGNNGTTTVDNPCWFGLDLPNVLCVGAVEQSGKLWNSSNRGARVEMAAFGVNMYPGVTGTSFSAPVVSGLASSLFAALKARGYSPTPAVLKQILIQGSTLNENLKGLIGNPRQASGENLLSLAQRVYAPWPIEATAFSPFPIGWEGEQAAVKISGAPISLRQLGVTLKLRGEKGDVTNITPTSVESVQGNDALYFPAPKAGRYWLSLSVEGLPSTLETPITINPRRKAGLMFGSRGAAPDWFALPGEELLLQIPGFSTVPSTQIEAWIGISPQGEETEWHQAVILSSAQNSEPGYFEAIAQLPTELSPFEGVATLVLRVQGKFLDSQIEVFLSSPPARHRRPRGR